MYKCYYCFTKLEILLFTILRLSLIHILDLSMLSLNMMAMCESYERTSVEYIQMATSTGFTFEYDVKLNELQNILKFKK